ncbi:MAG: dihydrofolate reductase [Geobacteraceae bacterium]|nr:dihydrofolate reductase [Geobacteraceae bacterium]
MKISLIAAMAENRVIGRGPHIPWDLPDDRKHFRELTWGHPVVMGRKTFETLDGPLPGRENIILSRDRDYRAAGCLVVHERDAALTGAGDTDELFICGGEEVYREFLPLADRIYLTVIHRKVDGDALFPEIPGDFAVTGKESVAEPVPHTFFVYEKKPQDHRG